MKIVKQSVEILTDLSDKQNILRFLELCGRTAYKSEAKITADSAKPFLKGLISKGHESVIEHFNITVKFICDRGVTHELVRHRIASYTQESTRYCNYAGKDISVIEPPFSPQREDCSVPGLVPTPVQTSRFYWNKAIEACEVAYNELIENGESPQIARSVLPNSLKTEIISTMNVRQWRHVLELRTDKSAHPQIRELMNDLLDLLQLDLPVLFEDIPNPRGKGC